MRNFVASALVGAFALSATAHAGIISDTSQDGDQNNLQCLFTGGEGCEGSQSGPWLNEKEDFDVNDRYELTERFQFVDTDGSAAFVVSIAGLASQTSFGVFWVGDDGIQRNQLFAGNVNDVGYERTISAADVGGAENFGFYIETPEHIWYNDAALNGGSTQMVAFEGPDLGADFFDEGRMINWGANEWILAWEDRPYATSDQDFNDLVVKVDGVRAVPAPAALALLGAGLIGIALVRRRVQVV